MNLSTPKPKKLPTAMSSKDSFGLIVVKRGQNYLLFLLMTSIFSHSPLTQKCSCMQTTSFFFTHSHPVSIILLFSLILMLSLPGFFLIISLWTQNQNTCSSDSSVNLHSIPFSLCCCPTSLLKEFILSSIWVQFFLVTSLGPLILTVWSKELSA